MVKPTQKNQLIPVVSTSSKTKEQVKEKAKYQLESNWKNFLNKKRNIVPLVVILILIVLIIFLLIKIKKLKEDINISGSSEGLQYNYANESRKELVNVKENLHKANYRLEKAKETMEAKSVISDDDCKSMKEALEDLKFDVDRYEIEPVGSLIGY